eukprot:5232479-Prorocentrum_lima.AAC.1
MVPSIIFCFPGRDTRWEVTTSNTTLVLGEKSAGMFARGITATSMGAFSWRDGSPVSYTHLTLPTICSV